MLDSGTGKGSLCAGAGLDASTSALPPALLPSALCAYASLADPEVAGSTPQPSAGWLVQQPQVSSITGITAEVSGSHYGASPLRAGIAGVTSPPISLRLGNWRNASLVGDARCDVALLSRPSMPFVSHLLSRDGAFSLTPSPAFSRFLSPSLACSILLTLDTTWC